MSKEVFLPQIVPIFGKKKQKKIDLDIPSFKNYNIPEIQCIRHTCLNLQSNFEDEDAEMSLGSDLDSGCLIK